MFRKKAPRPHATAVIVAAGNSRRMGYGLNKQFILIGGVPTLAHTLRQFDRAKSVTDTIVVCRSDDILNVRGILDDFGIEKVSAIIPGGATRQESVYAGIKAASHADIIAIHDGARPFVSPSKIDLTVAEAQKTGAAALGVPLKDTVKITDGNGTIVSTPERSALALIQTPQTFRADVIRQAYENAEKTGFIGTDDCSLVENIGGAIRIIDGDYTNIKVTTPDDLPIAQAIYGFLNK